MKATHLLIDDLRLNSRISNHGWLSMRVQACRSLRELAWVVIDIRCDQFEGESWTEDEGLVEELRREVGWKRGLLERTGSR